MYSNIKKESLYQPPVSDICEVIQKGLQVNFKESFCDVVQCPDLTQSPWGLSMEGLCGASCIGEIGGVPYLCPIARKEKVYDLREVGRVLGLDDGLIIGAGAGPYPHVGKNAEMITNLRIGASLQNNSKIAKLCENDFNCIMLDLPPTESRCAILMNFFACRGQSGPVFKIRAKGRKGSDDFVSCIRKSLTQHYGDTIIGMGGTFIMKAGVAKIHVMPDFSGTPLKSEADVNSWLKFFDMEGPMVFMSVFASQNPSFDFRLEHTHGYSTSTTSQGGGHYHYDITPESVEYEGFFSLAETIYKIDEP